MVRKLINEDSYGFTTKCVHAGSEPDPSYGSIATPIHQTATYAISNVDELIKLYSRKIEGFTYTSTGNPTQRAAEKKIAILEQGEDAKVFSSGMAAITTTLTSLLSTGDEIIAPHDLYGETFLFFTEILKKMGIKTQFFDTANVGQVEGLITPQTKVIYFETPTNPTLKLIDLKKGAEIAKQYGLTSVMDNTFASCYNQNPLTMGIDLVAQSGTKYLSGHHNVVCGVVVGSKDHIKRIRETRSIYGGILDPFGAFLLLTGIQTMSLRVERQNNNALQLAQLLETHPKIQKVNYPGLESHPQHYLAKNQMRGFGGMVSFELLGGFNAVTKFINNLRLVRLATSLGGVDTLMTIPTISTHGSLSKEEQEKMGISQSLIRTSIGVEDFKDIKNDIERALTFV